MVKTNNRNSSTRNQHSHLSCLTLDNQFKKSELDRVSLFVDHPARTETTGRAANQTTVEIPAMKKKRTCVVFSGQYGVQELFYVQEAFEDAAFDLKLRDEHIDEYWLSVLAHGPRQKWNNMWRNNRLSSRVTRKSKAHWEIALQTFRKFYASSKSARDDVIDYLKSEAVRKPHSISCEAHADKIERCCARANILHGVCEPLSEREIRQILFKSFPKA